VPAQIYSTVENNFTKGLITESTGLNFPENAATSTDNCVYTLVGDVTRRLGINYETNFSLNNVPNNNAAYHTFKWDNAGGDGQTQIVVSQVGATLHFYLSSAATATNPLSSQLLTSTVNLISFTASGGSFDTSQECQFDSGNGFLFVFHPDCDPFYCTFTAGTNAISANTINIQIRDFQGLPEPGIPTNFRPTNLTNYHQYNLTNQGWATSPTWNFTSHSHIGVSVGNTAQFTDAPAGLPTSVGSSVTIQGGISWIQAGATQPTTSLLVIYGIISSYSGSVMNVTINNFTIDRPVDGVIHDEIWYVQQGAAVSYVTSWKNTTGNYPSNADVWWNFKDGTGAFNPSATLNNLTLTSPAPKGSVILNAFNQQPSAVTGIGGLGVTSTTVRPRTGCWFQGRVWYAGADASSTSNGVTSQFYTWTENIYFSQIQVGTDTSAFGQCYQQNDPTSETLFNLLPTDGGVINIPGSGSIYSLFPIQNGLLVFAANGVWFITGSQGIGFSATDYTITKISQVRSISSTSFVNVLGLPYFWNEEGIYAVMPQQSGALTVSPLTVGTILAFFNEIPLSSRKYVRGAYDPINYIIQWVYRSTPETSANDRYNFDRVLNFNTYNKAFFPYTISGSPHVCSILYVASPGGTSAPDPVVKFFTQDPSDNFTFSEEYDESYLDFLSFDGIGADYTSFFITGYKLRGQAIKTFEVQYVNMFSRMNNAENSYKFQTLWDFSNQLNSNRWSTIQVINNIDTRFDTVSRRHKVRGRGYALQFKVASVTGQPFDIQGWAVVDLVNQGT
jgi:hypothetical protein